MKTIFGYTTFSYFAFLLLLLATLASIIIISEKQKDDGFILNLSGRQSMLIQQMVKEALLCHDAQLSKKESDAGIMKDQIFRTMKQFQSNLYALKDGGSATTGINSSSLRETPAALTDSIDHQIERVFSGWIIFKNNMDRAVFSNFTDTGAFSTVLTSNMALAEEMDKATMLIQNEAERKIRFITLIQIISISAGVVIVLLSIFIIRLNIVTPIQEIAESAKDMSMGELDFDISREGLKEIVELAESINRLRVSTVKIMDRLNRQQ